MNDTYSGMKVGYLYQDDDFGQGGVTGLDTPDPGRERCRQQGKVRAHQHQPGRDCTPQAAGAQAVVLYTIPAFTALTPADGCPAHFNPKWVVSSVGADPTTLAGLVSTFSKGAAGASLLNGIVTSGYLPATGDTSSPWITLFKQIHDQ